MIHQLFLGQQDTSYGATLGALTSEGIWRHPNPCCHRTNGNNQAGTALSWQYPMGAPKKPYFSSIGFISKGWKKLEQRWGQTASRYCAKMEQQLLAASHAKARCNKA